MPSRYRFGPAASVFIVLSLVLQLTGCGAVVTGAIAAAVGAGGGGGGGGPVANSPTSVRSVQTVGPTDSGTVTVEFTLTDPESDAASIAVRYSTDVNDAATVPFAKSATGSLTLPDGTPVADATRVATSPGGTVYRFVWNTAQDLGATINSAVRVQILTAPAGSSGTSQASAFSVALSSSTFLVDNTTAPLVVSAAPAALTNGATVYADEQNAGFIPILVTLADAEASTVTVDVLYSTDGGATFPSGNVAVGSFFDSSGKPIPTNAIPTSLGGTPYTFRFVSVQNGLGSSGQQSVVLKFTARDTKTGQPRTTSSFPLDNSFFAAVLSTPSTSDIADTVELTYLLLDNSGQRLDVQFDFAFSSNPSARTFPCTVVSRPPGELTTGLQASAGGTSHRFIWNAFYDMLVLHSIPADFDVNVKLTVTRPTTKVKKAPVPTPSGFSVDHRLVTTVFSRTAGIDEGVPATQAQLGSPITGIAAAGPLVYFVDRPSDRIRVVNQTTNTVSTILGGGRFVTDGTLALDFQLSNPRDVATSLKSTGTFFASAAIPTGGVKVLRVDGTTPIVTTLANYAGATPVASVITWEPVNDAVLYFDPNAGGILWINASNGAPIAGIPAVAPGGSVDGIAANWSLFPNIVFWSDAAAGTINAHNYGAGATTVLGTIVPPATTTTVATGLLTPRGLSIAGPFATRSLLVAAEDQNQVLRIDNAGAITNVAGHPAQFRGFAGDLVPAASAATRLSEPLAVVALNGTDFIFVDAGNTRLRRVTSGIISTLAGTFPNVGDQGLSVPSATSAPSAVASTTNGFLVVDPGLSRVRRVDPANGTILPFAGNGQSGVAGDGPSGSAGPATIGSPFGIAVRSSTGDVFVSEINDHVIRQITVTGAVSTVIGSAGVSGVPIDGTPATGALIDTPVGLGIAGHCLVIGADMNTGGVPNSVVLAVNAIDAAPIGTTCVGQIVPAGAVATIAGDQALADIPANWPQDTLPTKMAARSSYLRTPSGIACASNGDVYVADARLHVVFRIDASGPDTGRITTILGVANTPGMAGDNVIAQGALTNTPVGICLDDVSSPTILYVYELVNRSIRAVNLTSSTVTVNGRSIGANSVRVIMGSGGRGFIADGVNALSAQMDPLFAANLCTNGNGSVFFPDTINGRIRFVDPFGRVRTLAGEASLGGDGKVAENAVLSRPSAIAAGPGGKYAVMDLGRVREVVPDTTVVSRIAGTSFQFYANDGLPATLACFDYGYSANAGADVASVASIDRSGPKQVAYFPSPSTSPITSLIAIADTRDQVVRVMVDPNAPSDYVNAVIGTIPRGQIARVAGSPNVPGFGGDAGPAASALLNSPQGVAFTLGFLIVADTNNDRIRAINITPFNQTIAGKIIQPGFIDTINVTAMSRPRNIAIDLLTGGLVVQEESGGVPRISFLNLQNANVNAYGQINIAPGAVVRIDAATFGAADVVRGVAVDPASGDAYFCWTSNNEVWQVLHATGATSRIAGVGGLGGFGGDGGIAQNARFDSPCSIAVDFVGSIYVLDAKNFKIRRLRRFP